jgi:hypothetical protein
VRTSTRRQSTRLFAASFGPAIIVALVVGYLAEEHARFAWEPAAISGTGVATACLAFYTARLALSTSQDVSATRQLAEIERARFTREDSPLVVSGDGRVEVESSGGIRGFWHVTADVVNVGRGPARHIRWEAYYRALDGTESRPEDSTHARGGIVALVGGDEIGVRFAPFASSNDGQYRVRGIYADRDDRLQSPFGEPPPEGWPAWSQARVEDAWWGLNG